VSSILRSPPVLLFGWCEEIINQASAGSAVQSPRQNFLRRMHVEIVFDNLVSLTNEIHKDGPDIRLKCLLGASDTTPHTRGVIRASPTVIFRLDSMNHVRFLSCS
jgi:hypothetical protein